MSTPRLPAGHDIVAKAREFKGQHEIPAGSNTGSFVEACQHDTFLAGTGWPWCAAFVCHIAKLCGVPLAYDGAGAHDLADHHKPWVKPADVHMGMVVDYNIGSGHTGIVTGIDVKAGTLTSIDGNWGDAVTEHTMQISQVRAFWEIPGVRYGIATPPPAKQPSKPKPAPKPAKKRVFVVATSASGHRKVVFRAAKKSKVLAWLQNHAGRLAINGFTITRPKA